MRIIFIFLYFWASAVWAQSAHETKSIIALAKNVDWSCFKPRVLGVCAKPRPGVYVEYWEPIVVETVHAPGDYIIEGFGPIVKPLAQKVALTEMSLATGTDGAQVTSTNSHQSFNGSNLQFNEVHVYDFPLKLIESVLGCQLLPNMTLGIRYLSEADSPLWRMQTFKPGLPSIEHNLPQTKAAAHSQVYHIGSWGPLYPRTGFVVHPSSAVSSGLGVLRAMSIATEIPDGHIVESPLDFKINLQSDKMQMLYPQKTMCMSPGTDPRLWEPGRVSKDGNYVWIYWHFRRDCCSPVPPP